jgi:hypothetical protein
LYLTSATVKPDFSIRLLLMVALDSLNTLIFFCAAVVLFAFLGAHSCGNNVSTRLCACVGRIWFR